jgi:hypothetical protein
MGDSEARPRNHCLGMLGERKRCTAASSSFKISVVAINW